MFPPQFPRRSDLGRVASKQASRFALQHAKRINHEAVARHRLLGNLCMAINEGARA
jgi:hypothetical protein